MALTVDQMSSRSIDKSFAQKAQSIPSLLISADAHIDEPVTLWDALPAEMRAQLPKLGRPKDERPQGGLDPKIRLEHMDQDGVTADIIYPTATLRAFALPQEVLRPAATPRVCNTASTSSGSRTSTCSCSPTTISITSEAFRRSTARSIGR